MGLVAAAINTISVPILTSETPLFIFGGGLVLVAVGAHAGAWSDPIATGLLVGAVALTLRSDVPFSRNAPGDR